MYDVSRHQKDLLFFISEYHLCYKVTCTMAFSHPIFMFPPAVFQVNNDGIITTSAPLDRERESQYIITITAVDMGMPVRLQTADVIITINDVNDNSPSFTGLIRDSEVHEVLCSSHNYTSYTSIIEFVDSICRDSTDTQYMIIQKISINLNL